MASWKAVNNSFNRILAKLDNPPIKLLSEKEWREQTKHGLGNCLGRCNYSKRIIGIRYQGKQLKEINNTLWHEIAHILWQNKPHWWIECFAYKMCPEKWRVGRYSMRYNHYPEELGSKAKLIKLAKRASKKLKAKYPEKPLSRVDLILRRILEDD